MEMKVILLVLMLNNQTWQINASYFGPFSNKLDCEIQATEIIKKYNINKTTRLLCVEKVES